MKKLIKLALTAIIISTPPMAMAERLRDDYQQSCVIARDKHGKIARSQKATRAFKKLHPCPATGKSIGACKGYIIDHKIALKRCGKDAPENMQWQTIAEAKAKDKWE